MTSWNARHVVHGKNCIAWIEVKQAILHHAYCTSATFLGRLKNHMQSSIELHIARQSLGSS
jgi:hypothetical protein